jgi:choline transport protein
MRNMVNLLTNSYSNAWISILGWWLGAGSVANFVSSMVLSIVIPWYPDFVPQHWHQYLIYVALIWLSVAFNVFTAGWLPLFNKLLFVISAITLTATTLTLFAASAHNHTSGKFIFAEVSSQTGWSSTGWSFMLAVGNAVYSYLGSDCGAHLCEEIPNPSKNVPKVILMPLAMGMLTTVPFLAALLYCCKDLDAILSTATGLPLFEIYYQGTGSKVAATVLVAFFIFCFFGCLVASG